MILIPFISGVCFLIGGQWWKPARWLMGIPIAIIGVFHLHYWSILCVPTFWVATSCFPYGDSSWLNIFGEYGKWAACGFVFGLASIPILGIFFGVMQGIVGAIAFTGLHWLDERNIVKNPFQELLRGFVGTVLFFFA